MSKILGLDETFKAGLTALSFSDNGPALLLDSPAVIVTAPAAPKPEFTPS